MMGARQPFYHIAKRHITAYVAVRKRRSPNTVECTRTRAMDRRWRTLQWPSRVGAAIDPFGRTCLGSVCVGGIDRSE